MEEERLRQVRGVVGRVAPATNERVDRPPVALAQLGERSSRLLTVAAGRDNQAPASRSEKICHHCRGSSVSYRNGSGEARRVLAAGRACSRIHTTLSKFHMGLAPGTRLGPYEITAPIGAGGMGEVYRATDTRLQRDVALKVLPREFAADPDRLARFEREARAAAGAQPPQHSLGLRRRDG